MITRITGRINRLLGDEARLQVGPIEYQVLVPDFVRRPLQQNLGNEITLYTMQYFEGNPMQGRVIPRLIGFLTEAEQEFFELFCTVDKVGVRKALKALIRPIKDIAEAIQRQDSKWLTILPGIGPATAEQVVATLRRKVTRFALMPTSHGQADEAVPSEGTVAEALIEDAYQALLSVGHQPQEARKRLDKALAAGRSFESVEDILLEIYKQSPG
jgi:holliday junction DNA helicase RuvA